MASDVQNGEVTLSSRNQIAALNPGYDRADIQISFETSNQLDVDRLISSDGIVSDFGGGANSQFLGANTPNADGDEQNNSE